MKPDKFIILLIAIILICIGSILAIYYTQIIRHIGYRGMDVTISAKGVIGFNVDPDALHFGDVPPTAWANADLIAANTYNHKIRIIIGIKGNITDMITLSDNNFILEPGENRTITFTCTIPEDAPINATYTGRARVIFKRFFG